MKTANVKERVNSKETGKKVSGVVLNAIKKCYHKILIFKSESIAKHTKRKKGWFFCCE